MQWWSWCLLIVVAGGEFILSLLNHRINFFNISQQKWRATWYDLFANTIAEVLPFAIYVWIQNPIFMIPRVIGNTAGTFYASGKKPHRPTRKKKFNNKYPKNLSTA